MKNLILSAALMTAGFAGMAQEAEAGDRYRDARKRAATRRIVGGILDLTIGGRSYRRGGGRIVYAPTRYWRTPPVIVRPAPVIVRPAPVFVQPAQRFLVKYHMHGTRRLQFNDYLSAHQAEEYLESLGVHARIRSNFSFYQVDYHMHGTAVRSFYSHAAAHAFEQRLERLGIHAKVLH